MIGHDFGGTLSASRTLVADLHLGAAVDFVFETAQPEAYIAQSHVCVLASTFGEGISNALLEYMALAKPVVATACGGNLEVVQPDVTGYLVPRADPVAFAARIIELLQNPTHAQAMGEAGQRRVRDHFSIDRMAQAYESLYTEVLRGKYS